ncbi:MAG: ArsR family transcriptional regulator [Planctomycetota bacterium]|nr:MAG: ArsR family transcriptional regulator [Planctomycetota bacterium]
MLNDHECELLAGFFSLFANRTRLRILCVLREKPATVSELAEQVGVSLQNMSQHLRLMREKGLVLTQREGQHVVYRLADPRIVQAAALLREVVADLLKSRYLATEADEARIPDTPVT